MADNPIAVHLNDHLAGAVAALDLLDYLSEPLEASAANEIVAIKSEIEKDEATLRSLMSDLGVEESSVRKATGWITEKLAELKLKVDDSGDGTLQTYQALEALSLGIEGKRSLWTALRSGADLNPLLQKLDLEQLEERAVDQRARVDEMRIRAFRDLATG